jgi:hypothetical protein
MESPASFVLIQKVNIYYAFYGKHPFERRVKQVESELPLKLLFSISHATRFA